MIGSWRRTLLVAVLLAPSLLMYLRQIYPALVERYHHHHRTATGQGTPSSQRPGDAYMSRKSSNPHVQNLTVNLVLATLAADDISWTAALHAHIPNLRVIRYVSDDPAAEHVPPVPRKGREATIYHTYFHDFYDDLPDVSVMAHAHERAWHVDGVLGGSLLFALSRLDLAVVRRRGYANLRVSWRDACPDWINTSKTPAESWKQEEPFMREAFLANFDDYHLDSGLPLSSSEPRRPSGTPEVPEIMAGPCCSQFAVTREAIRARPRAQYARSRDWLVSVSWSDYIAGRTWEHMFPWLLARTPIDCPAEAPAYCAAYGLCFADALAPARVNELWRERGGLQEPTEFWREFVDPAAGMAARRRIAEIDAVIEGEMAAALERGDDEGVRAEAIRELFGS